MNDFWNELRNDIVYSWLPRRQESMMAVEKAQDEIRIFSTKTDDLKFYSSVVKVCSSVTSLGMKTASAAGVKGAGFGGDVAAAVSVGSDFAMETVNFGQAKAFQEIMEKAQQVIDSEMHAYKVVSDKMSGLGESVPRGDTKVTCCQYDIGLAAVKFAMTASMEGSRYLPGTDHTLQQVAGESEAFLVSWALGNGLPVLAAAWGIYKGGVGMSEASADIKLEEMFLATKLKELKDDASRIVDRFNAIAVGVDPIPIPFS